MPKRDYIIDRFETMNNVSDPKDLGQHEAVLLEGLVPDIPGQLRTMGKEAVLGTPITFTGFQTYPASGLFHTLVDRNRTGTEQETEWLLSVDKDTGIVGVLEYASIGGQPSAGTWYGALDPTMDLGTTNVKGVFHTFDGVIRGCNGNFANGTPKWYGYIKRTRMTFNALMGVGVDGHYHDDAWFVTNTLLDAPATVTFVDSVAGLAGGESSGDITVMLKLISGVYGNDNYRWHEKFEVAVSYIYDNNQESLLTVASATVEVDPTDVVTYGRLELYLHGATAYWQNDANFNPRITDIKIYMRVYGTEDWYLQGVYNLDKGGRLPYSGNIPVGWAYNTTPDYYRSYNVLGAASDLMEDPLIEHTYISETGHSPNEKAIDIGNSGDGWKASAILNRQVYLFGVKATNEDGEQMENGDLILVSEVNQPDKFLRKNALIATTGDGDHLVYGLGVADRIFSFKRKSMKVINIEQKAYIEDESVQEGVDDVDKVVLTDYGVAWINPNGLFLHNGKQYKELFKKKIEGGLEPFIDLDWFNTEVYGAGCGIAYNKYKQQIIISGYASGDEMIIYDFASGSVCYGVARIAVLSSNFVNDIAGNTLFLVDSGANVLLYKFDFDEVAYSNAKYWGRNEDFGDKGVKKYIYTVKIEYRNSIATNLDNNIELYLDGVSTRMVGQMLASQTSFVEATYVMPSSLVYKECKHAQVRVGGYDYDGGVVAKNTILGINHIIIERRILTSAR